MTTRTLDVLKHFCLLISLVRFLFCLVLYLVFHHVAFPAIGPVEVRQFVMALLLLVITCTVMEPRYSPRAIAVSRT